MIFKEGPIAGVFEIELERKSDERGYFARVFCEEELQKAGIDFPIRQANRSFSAQKGTVRGMHYQRAPKWEAKLMTALRGAFYTVVADLRPTSPTYKQWLSLELNAEKQNMLLVPVGCANGFQTLEDSSEMLYFMSEFYSPEHASGFNYHDPQFNISWPLGEPTVISEKDKNLPNFGAEI